MQRKRDSNLKRLNNKLERTEGKLRNDKRNCISNENGTPMDLLTTRADSSGTAICDYADVNTPVKGLPKIVEYNWGYKYFFCMMSKKYIHASLNSLQSSLSKQHRIF